MCIPSSSLTRQTWRHVQHAAVSEVVPLELSLSKTFPDPDHVESVLTDPLTYMCPVGLTSRSTCERYLLDNIHIIGRDAKIKVLRSFMVAMISSVYLRYDHCSTTIDKIDYGE